MLMRVTDSDVVSSVEPGGAVVPGPVGRASSLGATSLGAATAGGGGRAPSTLRGYRADWAHFTSWAGARDLCALPAAPEAITGYLTELAAAGKAVGTMSRRLSAIRAVHRLGAYLDPTTATQVTAVWQDIRRVHTKPLAQAAALVPPELFDVIDACPTTKTWHTPGRAAEVDLAGLRDRALILVGFVAALRRSELVALEVDDVIEHPNGAVLNLPHSTTGHPEEVAEVVVLPRAADPQRCALTALTTWKAAAGIEGGPLLRAVGKDNRARPSALHPESVNDLVHTAVARAGIDPAGYSAHSLRAGFVAYAHQRGASDRAIAHQSRHRSPAPVGANASAASAWTDNAATTLGL